MKLKPIPQNIVVHTPTEEEAKELLAILHENGYKWSTGEDLLVISHIAGKEAIGINLYNEEKRTIIGFLHVETAQRHHFPILTLTEFKERYCEEEKPQPKFNVGDIVRYKGKLKAVYSVNTSLSEPIYTLTTLNYQSPIQVEEHCIEPYTEPETKPTEDMEIKEEKSEIPINLCELLRGHEGETFFSLLIGECVLSEITAPTDTYPIKLEHSNYSSDGRFESTGVPVLYPSRALYEQYPLDPYTAWMKWREEQKIYSMSISYQKIIGTVHGCGGETISNLTEKQCDKCIEEIKAIIEKYSKK